MQAISLRSYTAPSVQQHGALSWAPCHASLRCLPCPAGKPDANIGGLGVGASSAAKLLQRYGSVDAARAAAERGELKGWKPALQELLSGADPAALDTLHRNRQLFSLQRDPALLPAEDRRQLDRAVSRALASRSGTRSHGQNQAAPPSLAELAWAHPLQAARWPGIQPYVQRLVKQLARSGEQCEAQAVVGAGLAADLLVVRSESVIGGGSSSSSLALFVAGPTDLSPEAAGRARMACAAAEGLPALDPSAVSQRNKALLPTLSGALRHHIQLVRKAGCTVVCFPWWQVP